MGVPQKSYLSANVPPWDERLSVLVTNTECNEIGYCAPRVAQLFSKNPAEKAGVSHPPSPLAVFLASRPKSVAVTEVGSWSS
ncbi:hypothetical protein EVAR_68152_1 [Eumeta japonica]|uniref:Uncharacterized protein n=1 Tax=Eumeta variegata TaxID=151549 RepID=A0A4C1SSA0_EUMVA|nr:hypothetical protein EVAR_68152_1 [Eumeta japonica]